jgi:hypothetical protein
VHAILMPLLAVRAVRPADVRPQQFAEPQGSQGRHVILMPWLAVQAGPADMPPTCNC